MTDKDVVDCNYVIISLSESEGPVPTHVVVLCNKRIYKLDVIKPNGDLHTPPQLERALLEIKQDSVAKGVGMGLSTLTSENRTTWYHVSIHM